MLEIILVLSMSFFGTTEQFDMAVWQPDRDVDSIIMALSECQEVAEQSHMFECVVFTGN